MTKRSEPLASTLLRRRIYPKPEYNDSTTFAALASGANKRIWAGLQERNGVLDAEIVATWIEASNVKVAAVDTFGNVAEFYLTSVNLRPLDDQQAEPAKEKASEPSTVNT